MIYLIYKKMLTSVFVILVKNTQYGKVVLEFV
jgi:hypothetical protein